MTDPSHPTSAYSPRYWAVVPGAGTGTRMQAAKAKQYLPIEGLAVADHTLQRLLAVTVLDTIVVALRADDRDWSGLDCAAHTRIETVIGGVDRCQSVLNALASIAPRAQPQDWVLVHDIARPCVRVSDIDRLIATLSDHPIGGLLAQPVFDTLKRVDQRGDIAQTLDRKSIWRAQTPQLFRFDPLYRAMQLAAASVDAVTDEAAAMERAGYCPRIVPGSDDNIKVTCKGDLALAGYYLYRQREGDAD